MARPFCPQSSCGLIEATAIAVTLGNTALRLWGEGGESYSYPHVPHRPRHTLLRHHCRHQARRRRLALGYPPCRRHPGHFLDVRPAPAAASPQTQAQRELHDHHLAHSSNHSPRLHPVASASNRDRCTNAAVRVHGLLPCITTSDGLLNLSFSRAQQIFQTLYYLIAIPFSFMLLADLLATLSIDDRHRSWLFIYIAIFITMFTGDPPAPRPLCQSQECGRVEPLLLLGDEYTIVTVHSTLTFLISPF